MLPKLDPLLDISIRILPILTKNRKNVRKHYNDNENSFTKYRNLKVLGLEVGSYA
jgi:hypothetical protein